MKLSKEWFEEVDITKLSDFGLNFLVTYIMLDHSDRRVDSNSAVKKLHEINNELYWR